MYTIENPVMSELEIKKSTFISKLFPLTDKEDVDAIIKKERSLYKDARHICYAYKIGIIEKCSDDGEPSGTAGVPILTGLKNQNLDFVLCLVIRYFGGIKLGAGGLIRAYGKSTKEAVLKAKKRELCEGYQFEWIFSYDEVKKADYLLKESTILKKEFQKQIIYTVQMEKEVFFSFEALLQRMGTIQKKEEILLKK